MAISEPNVGAHPKLLTTRATAEGDSVRIDGEKAWVSNGPSADAIIVFAIPGFFLAKWAMNDPKTHLENFLLVMSYWIGPWLGVFLADKLLRKGASVEHFLFTKRENWAGPFSFAVATALSIWLFAKQTFYTGVVPKHNGNFGDIAFPVGFAIAFLLYSAIAGKKVISER